MSEKETLIKVDPHKQIEVKLNGFTKLQVKLLRFGRLPVVAFAGILGGIIHGRSKSSINTEFATESSDIEENSSSNETTSLDDKSIEHVEPDNDLDSELVNLRVNTHVQFADAVNDEMSFGKAFETAREQLGGGGFFIWKGQPYSTYTKEEWNSFSDEQKKEFFETFKEQSDFENAEEEIDDQDAENIIPDETEEHSEDKDQNSEEIEPEPKQDPDNQNSDIDQSDKTNPIKPNQITPENNGSENDGTDIEAEDVEPDSEDMEIEEEFVELDELGTDDEIIDGLNDGEAFEDEDNFGEDFEI